MISVDKNCKIKYKNTSSSANKEEKKKSKTGEN